MIYVKINDVRYSATISGKMSDKDWDGRASKTIKLQMDYATAIATWVEGVSWSIVQSEIVPETQYGEEGNVVVDESGNPIMTNIERIEEFDNSEYNVAGDITDHRDGYISVKMGKLTPLEEAYEIMLGGI